MLSKENPESGSQRLNANLEAACRKLREAREEECRCSFHAKVVGDCSHINKQRALESEITELCMSYYQERGK